MEVSEQRRFEIGEASAAGDARRAAVAELWTEDGTYTDPLAAVSGHDGIAGLIGAVQAQFPGHVIRLADDGVDAHHDIGRFRWELVPAAGGEPVVVGFDVAEAMIARARSAQARGGAARQPADPLRGPQRAGRRRSRLARCLERGCAGQTRKWQGNAASVGPPLVSSRG